MLRWLSNTYDPNNNEAPMHVARGFDETQEEAWRNHLEWLKGKVIGDPQATEAYTVAQLKETGLVGVYMPNTVSSSETPESESTKYFCSWCLKNVLSRRGDNGKLVCSICGNSALYPQNLKLEQYADEHNR